MKKNVEKEIDLKRLCDRWPSAIVAREQIGSFSGGALSSGYLANLDSVGKGPSRFKIGRKSCYFTKDFVDWMRGRVSIPERNRSKSDEEGKQ